MSAQDSAGAPSQGTSYDRVVGTTDQYTHITYDPQLEFSISSQSMGARLEIDLQQGTVTVMGAQCGLDSARLASLREILSSSKVCEPGPLPPGTVSCMAYPMADIQLSSRSESLLLRPIMCHVGTFLCDNQDHALRALLADLRQNPPAACVAAP